MFSEGAKERLLILRPEDGERRYQRVEQFVRIAATYPDVTLIVPPEIDSDLHEILSARDPDGLGLEQIRLQHKAVLSSSVGKTMYELDHPGLDRTLQVLNRCGFKLDPQATYGSPACTLRAIASA